MSLNMVSESETTQSCGTVLFCKLFRTLSVDLTSYIIGPTLAVCSCLNQDLARRMRLPWGRVRLGFLFTRRKGTGVRCGSDQPCLLQVAWDSVLAKMWYSGMCLRSLRARRYHKHFLRLLGWGGCSLPSGMNLKGSEFWSCFHRPASGVDSGQMILLVPAHCVRTAS